MFNNIQDVNCSKSCSPVTGENRTRDRVGIVAGCCVQMYSHTFVSA